MRFATLLILQAWFGVAMLVGGTINAETLSEYPRRIAIVDGNDIAYKDPTAKNASKPNWLVLKTELAKIYKNAKIEHFSVSSPDKNGSWVINKSIEDFKPDIILAHWSAFMTRSEAEVQRSCSLVDRLFRAECAKYCDLTSNEAGRECSRKLFLLLSNTRDASGRPTRVIIYTRKANFCYADATQQELMQIVADEGPGSAAARMVGFTGFIVMTAEQDRQWFGGAGANRDLYRLIRYLECPSKTSWSERADRNNGLCTLGPPKGDFCDE